jgi:hypothetical protein
VCALVLMAGPVLVSAQEADEVPIYGSQLMTEEERMEYIEAIRAAESDEERDVIRQEHREMMKERAADEGITLPE